jgi:glyoxylase-like metal-dependent hydrolase (beta-lactamase superfamily II)
LHLGEFHLFPLVESYFRLDGGTLFGVVPKTLWEKEHVPDSSNRITLAVRTILLKTPDKIYLIDTGIGDDLPPRWREIYAVERQTSLEQLLSEHGVAPDQVDGVILTHLHFDHVGGATRHDNRGDLVPTFSRAVHYIQKGELEEALHPNERTKASYLKEDIIPLLEKGLVQQVEGDYQVADGVKLIVTGGHTRYHQTVLLENQDQAFMYLADLVPTASHLPMPYIMGLDQFPMDTLAAKKKLLPQAFSEGWIVGFDHDPKLALARLRQEEGRYKAEETGE